ncbi:MAG: apolipoprotein N-acyltransferase [Parachlamydiaceae bacterium]|nr:apolipoprotein N-acyltransferase [Parachlamydiaceae bacterium]
MSSSNLSTLQRASLVLLSLVIVAFGQPAWSWWMGLIAAFIGYALFWRVLLDLPKLKTRFIVGAIWFTAVQYIQLSWAVAHPYFYIYFIYTFFAVTMGAQFGVLAMLITPKRISNLLQLVVIASVWTLMEWVRLFFLSGVSWNPIGMALTGGLYPLQMASLWGIYGLSFWVMLVNLLALRAWYLGFSLRPAALWLIAASVPYLYGYVHVAVHTQEMAKQGAKTLNVALVQTAFPAEETIDFADRKQLIAHIIGEWVQILQAASSQKGQPIDLMVFPEYAVPCGTYTCVFPYSVVKEAFTQIFGPESLAALPPLESPFAQEWKTAQGTTVHMVNNAFWAQGLANFFKTGVVIGLEDVEDLASGDREHYSAALYFVPMETQDLDQLSIQRYEKRVLVPLGEYIPFAFVKAIAADYGIKGSFTCGKEAKVFHTTNGHPFGISICYEETFGDLTRENKHCGAQLLVNLTSGAWYPYSRLPQQHFTHARLRTVEGGFPLVRSSNIGVTAAVDSLGRTVAALGQEAPNSEWLQDSIRIQVPTYTYSTVYSHTGDALIVGICALSSLFALRKGRKDENDK